MAILPTAIQPSTVSGLL